MIRLPHLKRIRLGIHAFKSPYISECWVNSNTLYFITKDFKFKDNVCYFVCI